MAKIDIFSVLKSRIDQLGVRTHHDAEGRLHREAGPAIESATGVQIWYRHGQRHRADGPAVLMPDGTREWWLHGQLHREAGPAVESATGVQIWYRHGQRQNPPRA